MRNSVAVAVLWVLLVLSLVLNAVSIAFILRARQVTVDTLYAAKDVVDSLAGDTITAQYQISQTVPVRVIVPVEQQVTIPISTVIPIKTTVSVNVDAGLLGKIPLNIPIDGSVPINANFPVHIKQDVNISTTLPISMSLPINVPIRQTGIMVYLQRISAGLDETGKSLGGPGQKP